MRRCFFPIAIGIALLSSCAFRPYDADLPACLGDWAEMHPRVSHYARVHIRFVTATDHFALLTSPCGSADVDFAGRVEACTRVHKVGGLSATEHARVLDCRGNSRAALSDFDGAVADFNEALTFDPYNPDIYSDRGAAWLRRGDVGRSLEDFDLAVSLQPRFDVYYSNRAAAWLAKGQPGRASDDALQAIGFERRIAAAFANLGLARMMQGRIDDALDDFEAAIRLAPQVPGFYELRGRLRSQLGRVPDAIADFGEAIRLDPRDAIAYLDRADAWNAMGDDIRARADLEQARALGPAARARRPSEIRASDPMPPARGTLHPEER